MEAESELSIITSIEGVKSTCEFKSVEDEVSEQRLFDAGIEDAVLNNLCVVCGENDPGFHYGVQCCLKCKALFRKVLKSQPKSLKCRKGGNCPINHRKKRSDGCGSCRFQRCLRVGMRVESVLKTLRDPSQKQKQTWEEYLPSLLGEENNNEMSFRTPTPEYVTDLYNIKEEQEFQQPVIHDLGPISQKLQCFCPECTTTQKNHF